MEVTYIHHCGTDLSVVNAARVSFKKDALNYSAYQNDALIQYLARGCTNANWQQLIRRAAESSDWEEIEKILEEARAIKNHHSPFNHTFITLHVKAPIFVARQLVKHKFMPWNEVSRRYVDEEPEFYAPNSFRERAQDKKQGSKEEFLPNSPSLVNDYNDYIEGCINEYSWLLKHNVAPEQARMVLPQSMFTEWYWSGTLGAWADMYNLRSKPDTQEETRQIALECGNIIQPLFPVSWEALTNE